MKNIRLKYNLIFFLLAVVVMFSCPHYFTIVRADEKKTGSSLQNMSIDEIVALSQFDGRNYGLVTAVKDQGSKNICWAYASINASESSILRNGLSGATSDTLNLLPEQIAYRRHNRDADPLNNTVGEYTGKSWTATPGNPAYSAFLLSQWCGPISSNLSSNADPYVNTNYRLENSVLIDSGKTGSARIAELKRAVATYGAVTFSYNNVREVDYYNPKNETDYGVAHACTIIGWDDTINANKFVPNGATQNGGWLIKNSYSSKPYFYMSYDNTGSQVWAFQYAEKEKYNYNYFYDNSVDDSLNELINGTRVANVFEAKKAGEGKAEYVKAVNVSAQGTNVKCRVEIYTNLTDKTDPYSGTLSASGERIFEYNGYNTVELDNMAKIEKGTYYAIVVNVSSADGTTSPYLRFSLDDGGQSYKYGASWSKVRYSARIKAFTVLADENTTNIVENDVTIQEKMTFTGGELKPNVVVVCNGKTLVENVDYTVRYHNNINVGLASVEITGIGEYSGTITKYFTIEKVVEPGPTEPENPTPTPEPETPNEEEKDTNKKQLSVPEKVGLVVGVIVIGCVPIISHIIKIKIYKRKR